MMAKKGTKDNPLKIVGDRVSFEYLSHVYGFDLFLGLQNGTHKIVAVEDLKVMLTYSGAFEVTLTRLIKDASEMDFKKDVVFFIRERTKLRDNIVKLKAMIGE